MKKVLIVIAIEGGIIAAGYLSDIVVGVVRAVKREIAKEQSNPKQSHYSGSDTGARTMGFHPAE